MSPIVQLTVIVNADDVAGDGIVAGNALVGHERRARCRASSSRSDALVANLHRRLIAARANAEKRDAVAMARIHVGLDLEDESAERFSVGATTLLLPSRGCGGGAHSTSACSISCTPKLLMAEPKKTGDLLSREERIQVERRARVAEQLHVVTQGQRLVGKQLVEPRIAQALDQLAVIAHPFLARRESEQAIPPQVEHARKRLPMPTGQVIGAQSILSTDSISSSSAIGARTSRSSLFTKVMIGVARSRHTSSSLIVCASTPFGGVDHHHRRVDRGQHAVGVLGKILVARRVEQIDGVAGILELHDRAGDRDAALLLDLHPVRRRVTRALARLDGAGHLDRSAEEQQFFGQRRLARIRVGNDRERPPPRDIANEICRESGCIHGMRASARVPAAQGTAVRKNKAAGRQGQAAEVASPIIPLRTDRKAGCRVGDLPETASRPIVDNAEVRSRMRLRFLVPARSDAGAGPRFSSRLPLLAVAASPAHAQSYPNRPIRVIVPFSPGGAVDGPMRIIAQELSKRLGQGVIVENKPGAGATIGSEIVAKAAPDGYTLLLASQTNAISATLYPQLSFDPVEDFAPVSLIGREPGVLVVNPSVPATTLQDFIAYVKARPGQVDYASSGNGSGQHLFAALLASMTGMKMNHIPYRGSGQATTDLIGGQVQMSMPGMAGMLGHIRSGKLRALAVTGARRAPQLPDVPTVAESGVPGYEAYV